MDRYYLEELGKYPVIDREEQDRLFLQLKATGDPQTRHRLAQGNLRLVVAIAFRYGLRHRRWLIEDLIGEGNRGLMEAIDRFDPSLGHQFSTFADPWIKRYVRKALRNNNPFPFSDSMEKSIKEMLRAENSLTWEKGWPPQESDVAERLGWSLTKLIRIKRIFDNNIKRPLDVERPWNQASFKVDFIGAELEDSDYQLVYSLLQSLRPNELDVIKHRYGFFGEDPKNFTETGDRLGFSKQHANKLEHRALSKMRELAEAMVHPKSHLRASA